MRDGLTVLIVVWLRLSFFTLVARKKRPVVTLAWLPSLSRLLRCPSRSTSLTLTVFQHVGGSRSLFCVPLPLAPSCFVCDGHFASSGPLSRCVLQCCSISIHFQCVTDLVHLPSQFAVCPACNSQSPPSLDFLHSTCAAFTTWRLLQASA